MLVRVNYQTVRSVHQSLWGLSDQPCPHTPPPKGSSAHHNQFNGSQEQDGLRESSALLNYGTSRLFIESEVTEMDMTKVRVEKHQGWSVWKRGAWSWREGKQSSHSKPRTQKIPEPLCLPASSYTRPVHMQVCVGTRIKSLLHCIATNSLEISEKAGDDG